ncbi:MAG: sulfur carrier protein ThiS [Bacteroidota bacterium]
MVQLHVNDQAYQYATEISLPQLLKDLNLPAKGIAIAINQTVIPKTSWPTVRLKHDDKVLVIKATQGG